MKRTVPYSGRLSIDERYTCIYMEIQPILERDTYHAQIRKLPKGIVPKSTVWHLEDEERKTSALCGKPLHELCRQVSPALAMFGTPCKQCMIIVRMWLEDGVFPRSRLNQLVTHSDVNFRTRVHDDIITRLREEGIDADPFTINQPADAAPTAKPARKRRDRQG